MACIFLNISFKTKNIDDVISILNTENKKLGKSKIAVLEKLFVENRFAIHNTKFIEEIDDNIVLFGVQQVDIDEQQELFEKMAPYLDHSYISGLDFKNTDGDIFMWTVKDHIFSSTYLSGNNELEIESEEDKPVQDDEDIYEEEDEDEELLMGEPENEESKSTEGIKEEDIPKEIVEEKIEDNKPVETIETVNVEAPSKIEKKKPSKQEIKPVEKKETANVEKKVPSKTEKTKPSKEEIMKDYDESRIKDGRAKDSYSVKELKEIAERLGIDKNGKKADLVERILRYLKK